MTPRRRSKVFGETVWTCTPNLSWIRLRKWGLRLRCPAAGKPGVEIHFNRDGFLSVGTAKIFAGRQKNIDLRVLLDKSVIEVYANDGAVAVFTTVNAVPDAMEVQVFATGGSATLVSLRAWQMKPARFGLERFRS